MAPSPPRRDSELAEELAQLAIGMHDQATVEETVEAVVQAACQAVDCEHAGVTFVHGGGRVETAAATDDIVESLDRIQMETGEGPDMDVLSDRLAVLVSDTRTDRRWPRWAAQVAELGILSMLSVRLSTSGTTVGTLDLYDSRADHFDIDDQAVAHLLARHAAIALASARKAEHLWQAIDARKLVGQAQGIIMERYQLTADQAFAVLIRYSQDNNIKLRDIARELVDSRRLPGGETSLRTR